MIVDTSQTAFFTAYCPETQTYTAWTWGADESLCFYLATFPNEGSSNAFNRIWAMVMQSTLSDDAFVQTLALFMKKFGGRKLPRIPAADLQAAIRMLNIPKVYFSLPDHTDPVAVIHADYGRAR